MSDFGRRLIVDADFEATVGAVCRAIREEGLQALTRVDVREHFWRHLSRDFRRYVLIQAWSPALACDALHHDLEAGALFPTTFAVYELADGEAAVLVTEPMTPLADEQGWREQSPILAAIADEERQRIARVLERVTSRGIQRGAISPAA